MAKKTQLDYIVEELLGNESKYRSDLGCLSDNFVGAFHKYATDPRVSFHQQISDENVAKHVFGGFADIRLLHDTLWERYEENLSASEPSASDSSESRALAFAQALARVAPFFRQVYSEYVPITVFATCYCVNQ